MLKKGGLASLFLFHVKANLIQTLRFLLLAVILLLLGLLTLHQVWQAVFSGELFGSDFAEAPFEFCLLLAMSAAFGIFSCKLGVSWLQLVLRNRHHLLASKSLADIENALPAGVSLAWVCLAVLAVLALIICN
ncbi:hypothetical protein HZU75_01605 [Chitinibacter fontanus]|uniref:Uncharacterized protein n=1 Tax=Chitinibacter fontanus TaxID=1737446 RepID=A0A7D5V878_9NEIS|nr:hypothetical protein [Chitinibacter fontanus]QLI80332.1 hypothetical protein HZU75_01605 [Chitinibacter fontanus]